MLSFKSTILHLVPLVLHDQKIHNLYSQFDYNSLADQGGLNYSTQAMTLLFMIFVSLVLMNLLIAITVNNTELLKERGQILISQRKINELMEVTWYQNWHSSKPILDGQKENHYKLVSLK